LGKTSHCQNHFLSDGATNIALADLVHGSGLRDPLSMFSGNSVLIATRDQLATALALIDLDGVVRRLTLCPPDLPQEHLPSVITNAGIDAIVCDRDSAEYGSLGVRLHCMCTAIRPTVDFHLDRYPTEWVLLTSGTTGLPKMVSHSLGSLTAAINTSKIGESPVVWGTFYDVRRYGGLQVFFRAILAGGSFVLSSVGESLSQYLDHLAEHRVTHVLGTPSHWRRALMSPSARKIAPQYVRLSGELADQAILDSLHAFYPQARVGHAFASTEAGVAFEVTDGFEGFPAGIVGRSGDVVLKIDDDSLRVRSPGTAKGYIGHEASVLVDEQGFVDTGDIVERRGDRYYFLGRRGGIINVGGLKVHPEEVEAVINRHSAVRMSSVRSRRNPITGAIVIADVVLKAEPGTSSAPVPTVELKEQILQLCRDALAQHKVPAAIRFVTDLDVSAAGKLARRA
jgi:acyl-coenzyme A synthetase/AMP-(fatty) acid ligase